MTSALSAARVAVLEKVRAIEPVLSASRKTTAVGLSAGTTVQCDLLNYRADDAYNDTHWAILPKGPTGSGSLEVSRIKDFDQLDGSSNTVITVYEAFSAQVATGVDFYVSTIHPETIRIALNNATSKVYPWAFIQRRMHHVTNSRVMNGFWDFWKTTALPEWWKVSNADLVPSQDTAQPFHGEYNLKLVNGGTARYLASDPVSSSYLQRDAGETITLHAMIYAESANTGGISIQHGSGIESIVYHSGTPGWEEVLTAEVTLVEGRPGTPIEWHLNMAASGTAYFGPVWTEGGQEIEVLFIPPQFRRAPSFITEARTGWPGNREDFTELSGWRTQSYHPATHPTADPVIGNVIRFDDARMSTNPRLLVLEGEDYIEEATVETDVYAVDAPFDELLWISAIMELKMGTAQMVGSGGAAVQAQLALDWELELKRLMEQPAFGMTSAPKTVQPMFGPPVMGRAYYGADDR